MSESGSPTESGNKSLSTQEKVEAQINECLQKIQEAQASSIQARQEASQIEDPEERKEKLDAAIEQETKAARELKTVKRLQSGSWQGALGGAGIGATLGMGLGGVVGTLVGGVVSIPTTGLGTLAGVATGAIHGPWYGKKKKEELEDELQGDEGSKKDAKATEIAMENDEG